jgi:alkaline phosphatase D
MDLPDPATTASGLDRRRFLKLAAAGGAALALPAITAVDPADATPGPGPFTPGAFPQGVASGDPLPTSVLLWTRVNAAGRAAPVTVRWEVTAGGGTAVLAAGQVQTSAARDWTVTVEATGLQPGTTYHYRFFDDRRPGGRGTSPLGRTRTAPSGDVALMRLGVASCASYGHGRYHAYRHLSAQTMDAFLHLGDYIYEQASAHGGGTYGTTRLFLPKHEIVSLADYRARYRHYRGDPDLQELHRLHPMIHVWDDHEFTNDPFPGGAQNHQANEGSWPARVAAALQAYGEWMPTRLQGNRIHRSFDFGSLARLTMIDRQRRNLFPQPADGDLYLGAEQQAWLDQQLSSSPARWNILGNQTFFCSWRQDLAITDYGWNRRDMLRTVNASRRSGADLVVLSGDMHMFQAQEVIDGSATYVPGTGAGAGAVELICGSITSPGRAFTNQGPQVSFHDPNSRGYAMVTITPNRVQTDFWGFPNAAITYAAVPAKRLLSSWVVNKGTSALVRSTTAAS